MGRSIALCCALVGVGCNGIVGFGDEPRSDGEANAGAGGGSGGAAGRAAGGSAGSSGDSGSGGSSGAAGGSGAVGGAGGSAGAAGVAGGAGAAGSPSTLIYFQDGEATSGSLNPCRNEQPPVGRLSTLWDYAECDYSAGALLGTQSLRVGDGQSVSSFERWQPEGSEVWADFVLRVESEGGRKEVFGFGFGTGAIDAETRTTSVHIFYQDLNDSLELLCMQDKNEIGVAFGPAIGVGRTVSVRLRYDWTTERSEFWVREVDAEGKPVGATGTGYIWDCPVDLGIPSAWYAASFGGAFVLDDIRIAFDEASIDAS